MEQRGLYGSRKGNGREGGEEYEEEGNSKKEEETAQRH